MSRKVAKVAKKGKVRARRVEPRVILPPKDPNIPPLSLEQIKGLKVFCATPMYGGMNAGFFWQSCLQFQQVCSQLGVTVFMSSLFNESLIQRGRNMLVKEFLKTDCTHLFFIDADIKFAANEVPLMLQWDKDILCGIYPKKEINWGGVEAAVKRGEATHKLKEFSGSVVVNLANYEPQVTVPAMQPCEVWMGGTGFMLIKRSVFEKMAAKCEVYVNDVLDSGGAMQADEIIEFFKTSIEPGTRRLLSEDFHFCRVWREMGGKVHAAPWVRLAHFGTYLFEGGLLAAP